MPQTTPPISWLCDVLALRILPQALTAIARVTRIFPRSGSTFTSTNSAPWAKDVYFSRSGAGRDSNVSVISFSRFRLMSSETLMKRDASRFVTIADVMRRNRLTEITETFESRPSPERQRYATLAHGAQFVEVKVDPDLGTVRVTRAIEVTACGTIINPKASHSQEIGGVVWGIGMALQEATEIDHRYGRIMNPNLQHYHVPVNADVHEIETIFVEEDDTIVNPLGVKGMGELGMVGIPAAIANAVFHATGRRIRELPITPDKLL